MSSVSQNMHNKLCLVAQHRTALLRTPVTSAEIRRTCHREGCETPHIHRDERCPLCCLFGIEGGLTTSPFPHHRTNGSRIRRFGRLSQGTAKMNAAPQPECPLLPRQPRFHPIEALARRMQYRSSLAIDCSSLLLPSRGIVRAFDGSPPTMPFADFFLAVRGNRFPLSQFGPQLFVVMCLGAAWRRRSCPSRAPVPQMPAHRASRRKGTCGRVPDAAHPHQRERPTSSVARHRPA